MDDELLSQGFDPNNHVRTTLKEDRVGSDPTTASLETPTRRVEARLLSKESGVMCGLDLFERCFELLPEVHASVGSDSVTCQRHVQDGDITEAGQTVASLTGPANGLLSGERVALNYLQQLSGVATRTHRMVQVAGDYDVEVYDTRKTVPHHRALQKYAVRCGGGQNHRHTLADAVLVKDNHKVIAGDLQTYLDRLRTDLPVIVEVHEPDEIGVLSQYIEEGSENFDIDIIMLDNFDIPEVEEALSQLPHSAIVELSGGIRRFNLESYCRTGADRVSVGALTHSFDSLDLSLEFSP